MYVKSFGIAIKQGSVILANRTPFVFIIITLKKEISRENKNNIYFIS